MPDEFFWADIRAWVPAFRPQRKAEASPERAGEALTTGVGEGAGIEKKKKASKMRSGVQSILPRILSPQSSRNSETLKSASCVLDPS